jgi:uroporphyrin-III C-methyltransferase
MTHARTLRSPPCAPFVALVGAGPGDPELLTLKAVRHLARADVILIDALVDERVLEHARKDARIIDVGKRAEKESVAQDDIDALLVAEALRGAYVVRLKGGDPFVFGRGGEEVQALVQAGIAFEVVPGVSSSIAVPSSFGIPVTHRGVANAFTVITGTAATDDDMLAARWHALAAAGGTLVFLMARRAVARIVEKLRAGGLAANTPCALLVDGTRETARAIDGTLENIVARIETARNEGAAMFVVGDVVALRHTMQSTRDDAAKAHFDAWLH